jgi:hypothetical protein
MADVPQKIVDLSGEDWAKGCSFQDTFPVGGIFQLSSYNFDPFDLIGYLRPALSPVVLDDTKITKVTNAIVSLYDAVPYVFALADRSAGAAKNLFRIKVSDNTVTDYSLNGGSAAGARTFRGLGSYKGRLVFMDGDSGTFYSVLSGGGTEISLYTPSGNNLANCPPVFHVAPDKMMYFTVGVQNGQLGRIDSVTGAGSSTDAAFTGDTNLVVKDMTSDGRYEIILMDDNPTRISNINAVCNVYFWDMDKADADLVISIPDSYLISGRFVDGRLLILGASGLWQCGIGTSPRLIVPLPSTALPANPYQVSVQGNILYWASASTGQRVYGYGAKIGNPILFSPFQSGQGDQLHTTFLASGNYFYSGVTAGTGVTKMQVLNSGSTRGNATVSTAYTPLSLPYKVSYVKVVLKTKFITDQAVAITLYNSDGDTLMDTQTKSYSVDGAKKTFIFYPKQTATSPTFFDDLSVVVNPQNGAIVQRVTVYGTPVSDNSQLV